EDDLEDFNPTVS
uniref:Venom peptide Sa81 n=1 Tax=Sphex argentatus argentatus TaxID=2838366 RepID=VP81_SPHAA|nr:RecName: Full=Venom peptide Sa81 [Sphex argentatus argentatus]